MNQRMKWDAEAAFERIEGQELERREDGNTVPDAVWFDKQAMKAPYTPPPNVAAWLQARPTSRRLAATSNRSCATTRRIRRGGRMMIVCGRSLAGARRLRHTRVNVASAMTALGFILTNRAKSTAWLPLPRNPPMAGNLYQARDQSRMVKMLIPPMARGRSACSG